MADQHADQSPPPPPSQAPDPAHNYERAKPERESDHGGLDQKPPAPHDHPDVVGPGSTGGTRTNELTADIVGLSTSVQPSVNPSHVQHSMRDEEPDGWDQAPNDINNPQHKRHSRIEGKGGLS